MKPFVVGGRKIGPGEPVFIIAEAGVNHNGDLECAKRMVDVAAEAGADAVKFQTFRAEQVISPIAEKAEYQKQSTGGGGSQLDMARKLELAFDDFAHLSQHCAARGILFLSTPFDDDSIAFLDGLGMPLFKVPSSEITNFPYLIRVAATRKPAIMSTGMATLHEVDEAVRQLRDGGCPDLAVLHCVSSYPAAANEANLRAMDTLAAAFGVTVGYSDHTLGVDVALAAVARGATVLEKHFTLDKTMEGPDHRASLDPSELKALVIGVRRVEVALGHGRKEPSASEANVAQVTRRSLFLRRDIVEGDVVKLSDLIALRPAGGISPALFKSVIGRRAVRPLIAGARLEWAHLR